MNIANVFHNYVHNILPKTCKYKFKIPSNVWQYSTMFVIQSNILMKCRVKKKKSKICVDHLCRTVWRPGCHTQDALEITSLCWPGNPINRVGGSNWGEECMDCPAQTAAPTSLSGWRWDEAKTLCLCSSFPWMTESTALCPQIFFLLATSMCWLHRSSPLFFSSL